MEAQMSIKAGHAIIKIIESYGIKHGFCVPGESFLEILDGAAQSDQFDLIQTRHEGAASFMAEAYGKLTGKPSILMVTRGPGACHGAIGIHTAFQDSTPMVVIIGDVATNQLGKEAFQEIDFPAMFAPIAKWTARITDPVRIPEILHKAFNIALSGRPGPVVLSIPEDVLNQGIHASTLQGKITPSPDSHITQNKINESAQLLLKAEKPLFILGGSTVFWDDQLVASYTQFFEKHKLPFATSFRRQDLANADSPSYCGELGTGINPALKKELETCDLVIAVGTRLGEIPSQGYELFNSKYPLQKIISVHPDPIQANYSFHPEKILPLTPKIFLDQISKLDLKPSNHAEKATKALRDIYKNWALKASSVKIHNSIDLSDLFLKLRSSLPDDTIITNDAGNASGWGHRFFNYARPRRQLAPVNGAMGYAVPSAIAAKFLFPDRPVVGFVGDGAFLMTGQELATAKQFGLKPVIVIMNNNMYGTIRMHQEKRFPGNVASTDLENPDFTKLAEAFGFEGKKARSAEEAFNEIMQALQKNHGLVLEIPIQKKQISTASILEI